MKLAVRNGRGGIGTHVVAAELAHLTSGGAQTVSARHAMEGCKRAPFWQYPLPTPTRHSRQQAANNDPQPIQAHRLQQGLGACGVGQLLALHRETGPFGATGAQLSCLDGAGTACKGQRDPSVGHAGTLPKAVARPTLVSSHSGMSACWGNCRWIRRPLLHKQAGNPRLRGDRGSMAGMSRTTAAKLSELLLLSGGGQGVHTRDLLRRHLWQAVVTLVGSRRGGGGALAGIVSFSGGTGLRSGASRQSLDQSTFKKVEVLATRATRLACFQVHTPRMYELCRESC